MAVIRLVDPNTDDLTILTVCDACGEEGHDAPAEEHDEDGNLEAIARLESSLRAEESADFQAEKALEGFGQDDYGFGPFGWAFSE